MNRLIKFTNKNNLNIEMGIYPPYLLTKFEESTDVQIYSSKGMLQQGTSYINNTLDIKDITLEFVVRAETQEELLNYQRIINKTFNPTLGEGTLCYKDISKEWIINCVVNKLPVYQRLNDVNYKCLISLTASIPFWREIVEHKANIAMWQGAFHFPLIIPEGQGIHMGVRQPSLIVNIENIGDVESGMIIEFKALGTLKKPSLFNVNTREMIKINTDMVAGEIIRINTNIGNKKVTRILDNAEIDFVHKIDLDSTFLKLEVGDNLFRYDAEENINNLEVNIYYNPNYLEV